MKNDILKVVLNTVLAKLIEGTVSEHDDHYSVSVKLNQEHTDVLKEYQDFILNEFEYFDYFFGSKVFIVKVSYDYFNTVNDSIVYLAEMLNVNDMNLFTLRYDEEFDECISTFVNNQMVRTMVSDYRIGEIMESPHKYIFNTFDNGFKTEFSVDTDKFDKLAFKDYSSESIFDVLKFVEKAKKTKTA